MQIGLMCGCKDCGCHALVPTFGEPCAACKVGKHDSAPVPQKVPVAAVSFNEPPPPAPYRLARRTA